MRGTPRSDSRGVVTVERVAVWLLAALAVAGLAALVVGPGADLQTATPAVDVQGTYDAEAGSVTVSHEGGDRLTTTSTTRLAVVVTDADRNATTALTWADEGSEFPVTSGDAFTVDDPRVDSDGDGDYLDGDGSVGFYLDSGDTVAVVWTGRLVGAPNERTATLGTVTVGDEST
ncbi:type IV pilin [Halomicroarcula sp. F13]|uniref:Type IV pilin n=1 Tax=Haloarcula rubra TaxID=2487747 RepID=A0AAW4PLV4_9EURY|nr:type IV pilin [Halomicroarcula rubra]MBX0321736.1 type IV pilin [Halomicroarcula rubra]